MASSAISYAATPLVSPVDGNTCVVGVGATGVWVGQDNQVAYYNVSGWVFSPPIEGMEILSLNIDGAGTPGLLKYSSGAWVTHPYGGGAGTGDVVGPSGAVDGNIAVFNGTGGKVIKDSGSSIASLGPALYPVLQELTADPASPTAGQTWVLKTPAWAAAGQPIGLLLALTYAENQIDAYQFSFRTLNGYTKRVTVQ